MGMGFFVSLSRIEHIVFRELFMQDISLCNVLFSGSPIVRESCFVLFVSGESMNYFDTSMLAGCNILTKSLSPQHVHIRQN